MCTLEKKTLSLNKNNYSFALNGTCSNNLMTQCLKENVNVQYVGDSFGTEVNVRLDFVSFKVLENEYT